MVYAVFLAVCLIWAGRVVFGEIPVFKVKVDVELGSAKAGAEASASAPLVQQQVRSQFIAAQQPINVAALRVPTN